MRAIAIFMISFACNATTYNNDAQPIFKNRCSLCHNAESMPDKNWMEYDQAKAKSPQILIRLIEKKDMPPGNVTNITDAERMIIKSWIDEGSKN